MDNLFVPYISTPTRVTHRSSTLIDNIYLQTKSELNKNFSYVIVDGMSDHYPCFVSYEVSKSKPHDVILERRKLSNNAILKIQQDLLFQNWSCLDGLNVHQSYDKLIAVINSSLDRHAPVKYVKIKADEHFREAWLTVSLKKCNVKCRKLCDKARLSGQESDHKRYKEYRNLLNKIKRCEKKSHYKHVFDKIEKNSQLLWNVINGILKKTNNKHEITELLVNGKQTDNSQTICDFFNEQFATAGKRVQSSIKLDHDAKDAVSYVKRVKNKMKFKRITEGHICKLVGNLKAKSSTGPDGISNNLLKKLVSVLKGPLCRIFNMSLKQGVFPDSMKLAKTIPLFKAGEQLLADNYRPISLLPVISKILEKHVYHCQNEHLELNDIMYSRQFGFHKNRSTSDAAANLVGEVLTAFEQNSMVLSLFIDLKKAFDSVSHSLILKKLEAIGVRNLELKWLTNYLTGRRQFAQLGNYRSGCREMTVGIPQGSLLGVVLFSILINDLPKCLRFSTSILYADDTTIFIVGRNLKFMKIKMQHDLRMLSSWLSVNSLKLNVTKTKSLLFNKEGLTPEVNLTLGTEKITSVKSFKFLGITVDMTLSFEDHYSDVHGRLLKSSFIVHFLSKTLPRSALLPLYYSYYHAHLTYALFIWFPLLRQQLQTGIYLLQKRIVRSMTGSSF